MQQNSADDVLIMVLCINEDPFQSIHIIHVHLYIENLTFASVRVVITTQSCRVWEADSWNNGTSHWGTLSGKRGRDYEIAHDGNQLLLEKKKTISIPICHGICVCFFCHSHLYGPFSQSCCPWIQALSLFFRLSLFKILPHLGPDRYPLRFRIPWVSGHHWLRSWHQEGKKQRVIYAFWRSMESPESWSFSCPALWQMLNQFG